MTLSDGCTGPATGGSYTVVSSTLGSGTHLLFARGTDLAGNVGTTSSTTTVQVDTTAPSEMINQASSQPDPTTATPVTFTATFSETVYGLTGSSISLGGSAVATTATITGSGASYTTVVSGMTNSGLVTVSLASGKVQDTGNTNTASTSTDNAVSYNDVVAPTVGITSFAPPGRPGWRCCTRAGRR